MVSNEEAVFPQDDHEAHEQVAFGCYGSAIHGAVFHVFRDGMVNVEKPQN